MESSILSEVLLPVALAVVMAGIGLSLRVSDFANVIKYPRTVMVGLLGQFVMLPLVALLIAVTFNVGSSLLMAGLLIIALAPGGVTSNLFTHMAGGEVAASISLTTIVSLVMPFTLPFLAAAMINFIDPGQIEVPVVDTIVQLSALTFIPVGLGMTINRFLPNASIKLQKPVQAMSLVVLFVIIAGAAIQYWDVLVDHYQSMLLPVLLLMLGAFALAYVLGRVLNVSKRGVRTITMEVGLQNGTVALMVTAGILQIPETTVAAMFYSLAMFPAAFVALYVFRRADAESARSAIPEGVR